MLLCLFRSPTLRFSPVPPVRSLHSSPSSLFRSSFISRFSHVPVSFVSSCSSWSFLSSPGISFRGHHGQASVVCGLRPRIYLAEHMSLLEQLIASHYDLPNASRRPCRCPEAIFLRSIEASNLMLAMGELKFFRWTLDSIPDGVSKWERQDARRRKFPSEALFKQGARGEGEEQGAQGREKGFVYFFAPAWFPRILDTCHTTSLRLSDSQYPRHRRISNLPFS